MSKPDRRISVAYGKVNLRKAGQTVSALRLKPPFAKDSAANTGKKDMSSVQYMQATRHKDVGGGFTRMQVSHPEGTVILLQSSGTKNGLRYSDGALILRLREGAPLLSISATLPTDIDAVLGDGIQIFQGTADICTHSELELLGFRVPKFFADQYMNEEEVAELFDISIVRAGTIAKPTLHAVSTSEGVIITAVAQEPVRRLRLRRNDA